MTPNIDCYRVGAVKDMPFSRVYAVAYASSGFVRFDEAHKL